MKRNSPFLLRLVLATICLSVVSAVQALKPVQLPPPQTTGGRPLMEVLKDRKSTREFGSGKLEQKVQDRLFLCTQNVDDLHEQAGSIRVVHMHGELFKSRCDRCSRPPFHDTNTYDPPAELPRCECGGRIRPHICWFGETPFELVRVSHALDECTIFMAVGTSGVVEPAASFVAHVGGRARTIYIGAEEPANAAAFTERHLGKAGETLPRLLSE